MAQLDIFFSYMGKSLPSTIKYQQLIKIISSHKPKPKPTKAVGSIGVPLRTTGARVDSERVKVKKMEDPSLSLDGQTRVPLAQAVSDCVKRWFQETLKEAKAGDIAMQVLVGQMYYSGYGVSKDIQKGRAWINRASKSRSSAWKVCDKLPGYNASDSDSDEVNGDTK